MCIMLTSLNKSVVAMYNRSSTAQGSESSAVISGSNNASDMLYTTAKNFAQNFNETPSAEEEALINCVAMGISY